MNFSVRLMVAALLFTVHNAFAVTLSTMTMSGAGHDLVTWNTWKGQSFSLTATTTPSQVVSVTLRLEVIVPNANLVVRIVGSAGTPARPDMSDVRAELRPASMPPGTAVMPVTFERDPVVTFPALEADATYWLVAGMTGADFDQTSPAGLVRWHYAGTHGQDPGAENGWSVGKHVASSDTGGGDWVPAVETPFLFNLTAVPVPEPVMSALLLPATLILLRRRRVS